MRDEAGADSDERPVGPPVLRAPRRPRREAGRITRRRLLDEGCTAFARDGLDGAAIKPVLDAVGVAPTVLYHHFGSKAGFFIAVAEDVYERFTRVLADSIAGIDDFDAALAALIDAATDLHRSDPNLAHVAMVVQFEARRNGAIRDELERPLAAFVAMARDLASRAPATLQAADGGRAIVLAVIGLLNGLSSLAVTVDDTETFASAAHTLRRIVVHEAETGL